MIELWQRKKENAAADFALVKTQPGLVGALRNIGAALSRTMRITRKENPVSDVEDTNNAPRSTAGTWGKMTTLLNKNSSDRVSAQQVQSDILVRENALNNDNNAPAFTSAQVKNNNNAVANDPHPQIENATSNIQMLFNSLSDNPSEKEVAYLREQIADTIQKIEHLDQDGVAAWHYQALRDICQDYSKSPNEQIAAVANNAIDPIDQKIDAINEHVNHL